MPGLGQPLPGCFCLLATTRLVVFSYCAAVVCAAVESANVVGYGNVALRAGSKIIGASFNKITMSGTKLTEIKPIGYENNSAFISGSKAKGCQGAIVAQFLTYQGNIDTDDDGNQKAYYWYEDWNKTDGWLHNGCWKQKIGTKFYDIPENKVPTLDPGQSLYLRIPQAANYCDGMAINSAGEALLDSATVPLRAGSKPINATVSKDIKLSDIKVVGYEGNPAFISGSKAKGCQGAVVVQFLTYQGNIDTDAAGNQMAYYWYEDWDKTNGWMHNGCWKQKIGTKFYDVDPKLEPDVKMGEGIYARIPQAANYCAGMCLEFPGIDDTTAAE